MVAEPCPSKSGTAAKQHFTGQVHEMVVPKECPPDRSHSGRPLAGTGFAVGKTLRVLPLQVNL